MSCYTWFVALNRTAAATWQRPSRTTGSQEHPSTLCAQQPWQPRLCPSPPESCAIDIVSAWESAFLRSPDHPLSTRPMGLHRGESSAHCRMPSVECCWRARLTPSAFCSTVSCWDSPCCCAACLRQCTTRAASTPRVIALCSPGHATATLQHRMHFHSRCSRMQASVARSGAHCSASCASFCAAAASCFSSSATRAAAACAPCCACTCPPQHGMHVHDHGKLQMFIVAISQHAGVCTACVPLNRGMHACMGRMRLGVCMCNQSRHAPAGRGPPSENGPLLVEVARFQLR